MWCSYFGLGQIMAIVTHIWRIRLLRKIVLMYIDIFKPHRAYDIATYYSNPSSVKNELGVMSSLI